MIIFEVISKEYKYNNIEFILYLKKSNQIKIPPIAFPQVRTDNPRVGGDICITKPKAIKISTISVAIKKIFTIDAKNPQKINI